MLEFIREIFEYRFLTNALLAAVLCGISCGIIGTYIVSRKLVFMSGGITHASFGGIGIAYYLGANPIIGALIFAAASAMGIEVFSRKGRISEDAATGVWWSLGMSVGIIFVFLTPGYAPNLMSFLFGNILLVSTANLISLLILDVVLTVIMLLFYRLIIYCAFDREYAVSQKIPTAVVSHVMMFFIAVTIVLNIQAVGIVLLMSLLTLPTVVSGAFVRRYIPLTVLSCVVAMLGIVAGLYISYVSQIPAGAGAVAALAVIYVCAKLYRFVVPFGKKATGRG